MKILVFSVICATLFQYGSAVLCPVCQGRDCEQALRMETCTPENSIPPFNLDIVGNGLNTKEYKCLEIQEDGLLWMQKCILVDSGLDFCQELGKNMSLAYCKIKSADLQGGNQYLAEKDTIVTQDSVTSSSTDDSSTNEPQSESTSTETTTNSESESPSTPRPTTTTKITTSPTSTAKVTTASVTTSKVTTASVTTSKVTTGSVTTAKVTTPDTSSSSEPTASPTETTTAGASIICLPSLSLFAIVIGFIVL